MSLKRLARVKEKDRGFKIWDLVVYGLLAVIIAVIFIAVFVTKDTSPLSVVSVYVDNKAVYEYDFTDDSKGYTGNIIDVESVSVVESEGDILKVRIEAHGGYNIIEIDRKGKVKVVDADCGKRDCKFMFPISDNSGIIYCDPHRLKIIPGGYNPDNGNIIV